MDNEGARLTHVDASGRAGMVDVGSKGATRRVARAQSTVRLPPEVRELFRDGELHSKKGPVFQTAIIAGTMAAKKTSDLIPLCHPLPIEKCTLEIGFDESGVLVVIECEVATHHRTGVEMEAITGASVAALCVYDMCKAVSHDIVIAETKLLSKKGGKRDFSR
jgi:cyclic pyranopterin monophosphate synthase